MTTPLAGHAPLAYWVLKLMAPIVGEPGGLEKKLQEEVERWLYVDPENWSF